MSSMLQRQQHKTHDGRHLCWTPSSEAKRQILSGDATDNFCGCAVNVARLTTGKEVAAI
jgi:hypothetical protein